jgi:hypothetical protein
VAIGICLTNIGFLIYGEYFTRSITFNVMFVSTLIISLGIITVGSVAISRALASDVLVLY